MTRPISKRVEKLEAAKTGRSDFSAVPYSMQIIAETEADREQQIADMWAAGTISDGMLIICRMIVDPKERT